MPQVKLNKSSLSREIRNLKLFQQFLPSLDLKRRKLLAVKVHEKANEMKLESEISAEETAFIRHFPMISDREIILENLIDIASVKIEKENIVGITLPVLKKINFKIAPYHYFNTPFWLESFITGMMSLIEKRIRLSLAAERLLTLEKSLKNVTQRKNLFDKVLIPRTRKNIRYVQIFLADNERAGVVRSKIAKKKRLPT